MKTIILVNLFALVSMSAFASEESYNCTRQNYRYDGHTDTLGPVEPGQETLTVNLSPLLESPYFEFEKLKIHQEYMQDAGYTGGVFSGSDSFVLEYEKSDIWNGGKTKFRLTCKK